MSRFSSYKFQARHPLIFNEFYSNFPSSLEYKKTNWRMCATNQKKNEPIIIISLGVLWGDKKKILFFLFYFDFFPQMFPTSTNNYQQLKKTFHIFCWKYCKITKKKHDFYTLKIICTTFFYKLHYSIYSTGIYSRNFSLYSFEYFPQIPH